MSRLNLDGSFNRATIMRNAWALAKQNMSGTGDIRALPLIKRLGVFLRWEWAAAKNEFQAQFAWRPHFRAEIERIGREAAEQFCRATLDYNRLSADRPSRDQMTLASRMRTVLNEKPAAPVLPVWKTERDLMARLTKAQNNPANISIDIMTFAGLCDSRAELQRHVERYEGGLNQ